METNENITPMQNPPRFDPKIERRRYYAVRAAGVVWAAFVVTYIYLLVHWINS